MVWARRKIFRKLRPRRRRVTRRFRGRRRFTSKITPYGGFPVRTKPVRLTYVDQFALTPSAGVVSAYAFRSNCIYDPNQSGTGHQPMGRDTWAGIYSYYTVIGSKITATFSPTDNATYQTAVGILLDNEGTVGTPVASALMERGNCRYKIIVNKTDAGPQGSTTVTHKYSPRKFLSVTNPMDNFSVTTAVGSSPTATASYLVWVGPTDESSDIGTIQCTVRIEYIVIFSKPLDMAQS